MIDTSKPINDILTLIEEIEASPGYTEFLLQNKLNEAVKANDTGTIMQMIYDDGFNIHSYKEGSITPLMWASQYGFIDIITILLNLQVDVNAVSFGGFTALTDAVLHGHLEVAKLLIENGADKSVLTDLNQNLRDITKNEDIIALLDGST